MNWIFRLLLLCSPVLLHAQSPWLPLFSRELKETEAAILSLQQQIAALPEPKLGNTFEQLGIHHQRLTSPPILPPFVQIDLGESRSFDSVALVPSINLHSPSQTPYAFPLRFRIDASDDPNFSNSYPLVPESEPPPSNAPIFPLLFQTPNASARFIRLSITKLPEIDGRWTFSLAELLILSGNRNIAIGAPVIHRNTLPPTKRWRPENLTDGRFPLGPPVSHEPSNSDGASPVGLSPWILLDLGSPLPIDEIRLFPRIAKQGTEFLSYKFPVRFHIEAASSPDLSDATTVFDSRSSDFPDPGNNPATFPLKNVTAQFIRITSAPRQNSEPYAFGLSQIQAYSNNQNAALGKKATWSKSDHKTDSCNSLLTGGFSSQGRILELPEWLQLLQKRHDLLQQLSLLQPKLLPLRKTAETRALRTGGAIALALLACLTALLLAIRVREKKRIRAFQEQLARDMHDEVGSNLAGIAVVSELASLTDSPQKDDWLEINRIARDTTDAMREVLWLVGVRQVSGLDLPSQFQRTASRLLRNISVTWTPQECSIPQSWTPAQHRELLLFFKESLTNISRHAAASEVQLRCQIDNRQFTLQIRDNGRGFHPAAVQRGAGLASLQQRARTLNASLLIDSEPGKGTSITLLSTLPS